MRDAVHATVSMGEAFDADRIRGYYRDYRSKTISPVAAETARDFPVLLVQLALGWWERYVEGEADAKREFLRICDLIESRAEKTGQELRWPALVVTPKFHLRPPWCSALTQGQAASVFVRAHLVTGEPRHADLARRAVAPLLSDGPSDLVSITVAGPILEEAPGSPASHILNGWISALWGVRDVHLGLGDTNACRAFHDGLDCLRAHLHEYDTGWWSRYSLHPHVLEDLAKPYYHRLHIVQLEALYRLTGDNDLNEVARRWAQYDRFPMPEVALAHTAALVVLESGRRRRWRASFDRDEPGSVLCRRG